MVRIISIFLIVLFPLISIAQELQSVEFQQEKAKAIELYKKKEYQESYNIMIKLFRENPLDSDINLGVARAAYASKRYNQAIMAYERLIETFPKRAFLYIELAQVYIALKDNEQAKGLLESAQKLEPNIKNVDINALIQTLEQQRKKSFFSGTFGVAYIYDTNVNNGPESANVVLGGIPLILDDSSMAQSSSGATASAMLNYVYRKNPDSKLLYVFDAGFFGKYYENSAVEENNFLWLRYATGARYNFTKVSLEAKAKADFMQYQSSNNVTSLGGEFKATVGLSNNIASITLLGYETKIYKDNDDSNGEYLSIAEYIQIRLNPSFNLTFGFKFGNKSAEASRLAYSNYDFSLRANVQLMTNLYVSPTIGYKLENYKDSATALETEKREDKQLRTGLTAIYYITKYLSADASYVYTHNGSNSLIYKYNQQSVALSVNYYF